ncbi:MAG: hypothetical protein JWL79_1294 [Frankiales bacterium]|nr:hypothetical protein [Frankiales bacterium]
MDLETALGDPAFDLPVPPDGLTRVRRQATRIRRRRQLALTLPAVTVVAVLVSLLAGNGSSRTVLYGNQSATPQPTQSPEPTPTRGPVDQTVQTLCDLPPGDHNSGRSDTDGPTGDPIDNCTRFWRYSLHSEPPALVAYQDKFGSVIVQPKADPLPSDAVVLAAGATQSTEAIELDEALGDQIGLGPDHCRTRQEAINDATRVVDRVGIAGWPIHVDDGRTDLAKPQCWGFAASPRHHYVWVVATDGGYDYPAVLEQIAKPLRVSLTECWSRAKALAEVQSAVARSSLKQEFKDLVYIRQVDEPDTKCTVIHMGGGGGIEFTLRGPV